MKPMGVIIRYATILLPNLGYENNAPRDYTTLTCYQQRTRIEKSCHQTKILWLRQIPTMIAATSGPIAMMNDDSIQVIDPDNIICWSPGVNATKVPDSICLALVFCFALLMTFSVFLIPNCPRRRRVRTSSRQTYQTKSCSFTFRSVLCSNARWNQSKGTVARSIISFTNGLYIRYHRAFRFE